MLFHLSSHKYLIYQLTFLFIILFACAQAQFPLKRSKDALNNPKSVSIKSDGTVLKAGSSVMINSQYKKIHVSAENKDIAISGSHNTIRLKGKTHSVTLAGTDNYVTVDEVFIVTTSGSNNTLIYLHEIDHTKPAISNGGVRNRVIKSAN